MKHDANRILDNHAQEWVQALANAFRKIAVLAEENTLLQEEIAKLKEGKKENAK